MTMNYLRIASWIVSLHIVVEAGRLRGLDYGVARHLAPTTTKELNYVGAMSDAVLGECQGDCSMDADCSDGLACFHRGEMKGTPVPGCTGSILTFDFCYRHYTTYGELNFKGDNPETPLEACEGDCDTDDDCVEGLLCYHRGSGLVPGCSGTGHHQKDFCYDPLQGITPSAEPSAAPSPTPEEPSAAPSMGPSPSPEEPSAAPSSVPSAGPSLSPEEPSAAPSSAPSMAPSSTPDEPDVTPGEPSAAPSSAPSMAPSSTPDEPDVTPGEPSAAPSSTPSAGPSPSPEEPSAAPSSAPSAGPSVSPEEPSAAPSSAPSAAPSTSPSVAPSSAPSYAPTKSPSKIPTSAPSKAPSAAPSKTPTVSPSVWPSAAPSKNPTSAPVPVGAEWTQVFTESFENDPDAIFQEQGKEVRYKDKDDTADGNGKVYLEIKGGDDNFSQTDLLSVGAYNQLRISFWFFSKGADNGDTFYLEWSSDESTWDTVWTFTKYDGNDAMTDVGETTFYAEKDTWNEVIHKTFQTNGSDGYLRFRNSFNDGKEKLYIDAVTLEGSA